VILVRRVTRCHAGARDPRVLDPTGCESGNTPHQPAELPARPLTPNSRVHKDSEAPTFKVCVGIHLRCDSKTSKGHYSILIYKVGPPKKRGFIQTFKRFGITKRESVSFVLVAA